MDCWASIAFLDVDVQLEAAKACETCGFAGMAVPDHLFYAKEYRSQYPYSSDGTPIWSPDAHWPDPWALIAAMAALTERLRFTTNIYVAPARDLFTVAKGVSTAAVISHNRVALGLAAGWCEDEFAQTGQDFSTRGRRLDEMIVALRALFRGGMVEHHGRFFDFEALQISPVPAKPVPMLVGGNSKPAMRRAALMGDGWIPASSATPEELTPRLEEMQRLRRAVGRDHDPFEVIVALHAPPDVDLYRRFEDLGVTGVIAAPWLSRAASEDQYGYDADHVVASIERFGEDIVAKL